MGLQDFMTVFNSLDPSCKGFITIDQLLEFYQSIYYSYISVEQVESAVSQICGSRSGPVTRQIFMPVLEELERRRSIEEQAYWDFQALDYKGTCRISLKDALMMFREFHGDRFSLYTWREFLKSRDNPDENVYFDEIRLWLCNYPSGAPSSQEQITQEEDQLLRRQSNHQSDTINKLKQIQDNEEELQEYLDNAQYNSQRRRNKWDRQGLEAMLFDDGLEADEDTTTKPKDVITMSDLNDALSHKYDKLKSKLLWEMAKMSAAMESDRHEIFQQLCREEKQYSREGSLQDRLDGMSGSRLNLVSTLMELMGEVRSQDTRRKEQAQKTRENMRQQGMKENDINNAIQTEYDGFVAGDSSYGATLLKIIERFNLEKEDMMLIIRSKANMSAVVMESEYYRLLRQHFLLTEEADFPKISMSVGLAERPQEYKSSRETDWDRGRCERLAKIGLVDRKGKKLQHTPPDHIDTNKLDEMGLTDLKQHLIKEIVDKHFFEREAMINMLQGRESEQHRKKAYQMSSRERKKRLKVLRNQQISWSQSNSDDTKHLHQILIEAVAIYSEVRREELLQTARTLTEEVVSECVLADLIQRQEVEFEASLEEFLRKQMNSDVIHLIKKENKIKIKEHFDNISFVTMGTVEILPEEKEYVDALDKKYDTLRKNILRMGLQYKMGSEWKQLHEKERKKHIKEKEKEERKLRGQGQLEEMEGLIGPKSKTLPPLRQLIGEEKAAFEKRLEIQKSTGQIQDEPPLDKQGYVNVLADLIPRYDNEQEAMLVWLKSNSTKQLPIKTQRLKIVLLRLETFCVQLEEDFEASVLAVGLMERLMAVMHNRHPKDVGRQYDLAKRRTRLRMTRIQEKEPRKKKEKIFTAEKGDLTGWQTAYLYEVMRRHDNEREQLLKFLQDEAMTELMEAASDLSDEERKARLAELQTKRKKLNVTSSGDKEDYISILEEAVAISCIFKKSSRMSMEDITVTTLKDLQDTEDKELAKLLLNIGNMTEDQLETKVNEEKEARQNGVINNVFDILTQTEDSVKEEDIIEALEKKYARLQDSLLSECLCHSCGKETWDKLGQKDKLIKLNNLRQEVKDMVHKGDHVGLKGVVDVITLEKSVRALIGINRHQFLQRILGSDMINEEDITDKMNPILEIQHRHQDEMETLLQMIKGSGPLMMDAADQQIQLIRLKRETFLGNQVVFRFSSVAMVIGLAERQQTTGKPRLVDDRQRYEMVAMATLQEFSPSKVSKKKDLKDEIVRGQNKNTMMESMMILLDKNHQDEQQYMLLLLSTQQNPDVVMEIQSWSQQQRKDELWKLQSQRQEMLSASNKKEPLGTLFNQAVIIKKEIYRQRLNNEQKEEVDDEIINKMLVADLLVQQNCDAEIVLQSAKQEDVDLIKIQSKISDDRRNEVRENVAIVLLTSETCDSTYNEETELVEALDGKYDALRDKLLAEALIKQLGETEWNRLSELERQKKLAELKLKERRLRREGKFDEVANILGEALEDQETLDRLFGENKEEQERRMKERLHRRKQRLAAGMSEEECDKLEAEEIKQEEEEDRQKRRNILLDLDHRCEQEKEELMRRLREQKDRVSLERQRQLELMKLKHDEKKARREEKFNSAALVIGKAKDEQKKLQQNQEDERQRQERLAKERLEAARKRRGKKSPELDTVTNMEDKNSLQVTVGELIDRRHREERDMLIQLLEEAANDSNRKTIEAMSEEERQDNLERLRQMRSMWRSNDQRNKQDHMELLKEAAVYLLESRLHQMRSEGQKVTDDTVKIQIVSDLEEKQNKQKTPSEATDENVQIQVLTDLQEKQDGESKSLLTDIHEKDVKTLQQMVKLHRKSLDDGNHDNVSSVMLGDDDSVITSVDSEATEDEIKKAVEQKYDILRGKLLEAALIMQVGENEWSKLSDKEKQKRLIELKMKEKKLRQQGKNEEATALYEQLLENDEFGSPTDTNQEALENLFGGEDEISEEQKSRDREQRKKELQREREEQGLPIDDAEIEKILDEEEKEAKKQKRKNVLDNLQIMLEDEKAALMRMLKQQVSGIDQERQRQLALVKLKMDKKKMEREEKYDSAALVLKLAKEAEEKRNRNVTADRERQKALAKERLEALRRKKQQKVNQENLEQKLKEENENNKLLDAEESSDIGRIQTAVLEVMDGTHIEERELMMDLINTAKQNKTLSKTAKDMSPEQLKMELSRLEQDHSKWKKKSQQTAMSMDDSTITQKEENQHLKDVANNRKEQSKLLSDALVYRLELEERLLKTSKPDVSSEDLKEEISVTLLADLQEQQERDSTAVQDVVHKQQTPEDLNKFKRLQRLSHREGWFHNLTKTLFQLSSPEEEDTDEGLMEALEKNRQEMENSYQAEREAKIQEAMKAKMEGREINIQEELKQLEEQQQAKRKALDDDLAKQKKALQDRINARKMKGEEKEEEEMQAYHLTLLAQSQAEKSKQIVSDEKSRQSSKLQDKIRLRKEERHRIRLEAGMNVSDEEGSSRPSTVDSKGPPPFGLHREKTVVAVDITEDQKQAVFTKLVRETTSLHDKIREQQKQQAEMLQRRLDKSRGKKEMQAKEILDMSERQKKEYHKTKTEERDRQLSQMQQKISSRRARSRSPNPLGASPIPEGDSPVPSEGKSGT